MNSQEVEGAQRDGLCRTHTEAEVLALDQDTILLVHLTGKCLQSLSYGDQVGP